MEIKSITPDMEKALREPLPDAAISQHPTKTYLSSIKGVYITERINKVFGIGSWKLQKEIIERGTNGMVVVDVTLRIPEYGIELSSYGGNDNGGENNKNFDLGDAYKGAVTDALTKIGSFLEIGIDVFKGLNDRPAASKTSAPADAPWLNDQELKEAIEKINNGESGVFDAVISKFKVSKKYREILAKAEKDYKPSKNDAIPQDTIDTIEASSTTEELVSIWNDLSGLHTNQQFIDLIKKRKSEILSQNKKSA